MNLEPSEEQRMLSQAVAAWSRDHYSFERRRAIADSRDGWSRPVWEALMRDLGLGALAASPDPAAVMVVMEELGAALLLEPFLETIVVAGGLLRRAKGTVAVRALRCLEAGETICALAWAEPTGRYRLDAVEARAVRAGDAWRLSGRKSVVVAAPWASSLLVTAQVDDGVAPPGIGIFAVEAGAPGVRMWPYRTVDSRRAADLELDEVVLEQDALIHDPQAATSVLETVADEAVAALCAEAVGIMRRLHRDTVAYLKQRRQFGRPLFEFQAVQHRLVDMLARIELASAAACRATIALGEDGVRRARAASAAKAVVDDAARFVGENAVQLHGGMGMTVDLPIGHLFRRLLAIGADFGSRDHHLDRYASLPDPEELQA